MKWIFAHPEERYACRAIGNAGGWFVRESWCPLLSRVTSICLRGTNTSDTLLDSIPPMPSLTSMELGYTQISDVGIATLVRHPQLHYLFLWGNEISDDCLESLMRIPLFMLNVESTQISFDGCKRLSEKMPECLVCHSRTKLLLRGKINADEPYREWLKLDDSHGADRTAEIAE